MELSNKYNANIQTIPDAYNSEHKGLIECTYDDNYYKYKLYGGDLYV